LCQPFFCAPGGLIKEIRVAGGTYKPTKIPDGAFFIYEGSPGDGQRPACQRAGAGDIHRRFGHFRQQRCALYRPAELYGDCARSDPAGHNDTNGRALKRHRGNSVQRDPIATFQSIVHCLVSIQFQPWYDIFMIGCE